MLPSSGLRSVAISSCIERADMLASLAKLCSIASALRSSVLIMVAIVAVIVWRRAAASLAIMRSRIWSATGRMLSGVVPGGPNMAPMKGSMSTIMILETASGWRAASAVAIQPPIEWPMTAGRSSRASAM